MKVGRHKSILVGSSGRLIKSVQALSCVKRVSVGRSKGCSTHVPSGTVRARKTSYNSILVDVFSDRGITEVWVTSVPGKLLEAISDMSALGVIIGDDLSQAS